MRNGIYGLFADVKEFFNQGMNGILTILIICMVLIIGYNYKISSDITDLRRNQESNQAEIIKEIENNRKKIHYRYFNLTKSLEDINNVEINTRDGSVLRHK